MLQHYLILILSFIILLLFLAIISLVKKNKSFRIELAEKENLYTEVKAKHDLMYEEICSARDIYESKKTIAERNKSIVRNITNAVDFQKTFFAQNKLTNNILQPCFVFEKAKEIISGDFHWMEEVDNKVYLFLGDCSGHGVEASFMSILASELIKENILNITFQDHHNAASNLKQ